MQKKISSSALRANSGTSALVQEGARKSAERSPDHAVRCYGSVSTTSHVPQFSILNLLPRSSPVTIEISGFNIELMEPEVTIDQVNPRKRER